MNEIMKEIQNRIQKNVIFSNENTKTYLYTIGFILYLLYSFNKGMMTNLNPNVTILALYGASFFVILKIVVYHDIFNWKYFSYLLITIILYAIGKFSWSFDFYYLFMFIIGSKDIDFSYLMKLFTILISLSLIIIIILALTGVVENLLYMRRHLPVYGFRFALGTIYPTDLASRIFYLTIAYYILRGVKITKIEIFNMFVIAILTYIVTKTRLDLLLSMIFLLAILFDKKIYRFLDKVKPKYIFVTTTAIIIFDVLLGYIYNPKFKIFKILDKLLSQRLSLERRAFNDYNVQFLGQTVHQNGYGGGAIVKDYFFIDASFVRILLMLGVFGFVTMLILILKLEKKFIEYKAYTLLLALIFVILSSCIDQHLLEISYTIIFLALFADISKLKETYDMNLKS